MRVLAPLALLAVFVAGCGKREAGGDDVLLPLTQRFAKMVAAFDADLPACTQHYVWRDVPLFNWAGALRGAGQPVTGERANWGHENNLALDFDNPFNPKSSQLKAAKALSGVTVILAKVIEVDVARVSDAGTFEGGTLRGRAVVFDPAGTGVCAVEVRAQNSDKVAVRQIQGYSTLSFDEEQRRTFESDLAEQFNHKLEDALF